MIFPFVSILQKYENFSINLKLKQGMNKVFFFIHEKIILSNYYTLM